MADDAEQIRHFQKELDKLIFRYRKEYDITYASLIGILFACAQLMVDETKVKIKKEEDKE